jgi:hypothetical protein
VSLEFFMYLGTNSNVASGWTRIINLDGFWGDGDGFEIEFYGTSDSRIFAAFSYGLTGNRDSISIDSANTDNLRTERWHYVRMCREIYYMGEFTNTRATMHIGPCTDDAGSTNTTVARVLNDTTTSHATHGYAWESLPSSGGYNSGNDDNRFLHLGQAPYTIAGSGSANSYIGGISDVVMRVMDPMAYYKNGQTDLTIPTWSQVFTNPNSPNYLGIS